MDVSPGSVGLCLQEVKHLLASRLSWRSFHIIITYIRLRVWESSPYPEPALFRIGLIDLSKWQDDAMFDAEGEAHVY